MDLSHIRLVVTDMDGTLLNSRHELHPGFFDLFRQLREKQIIFTAASGRQYHNIRNVFSTIKDDMYYIAENGGIVMHREQQLHIQEMDPALTFQLIREAKEVPGTFTILCGRDRAYVEDKTPSFLEHLQRYYDEFIIVDNLLEVSNDQFLKIAICDVSGAEGNALNVFRNRKDELQIKVSGDIWLDISHKMANKGHALERLQKHLGIDPAETIVFGDYLNDLEMMQQAHFSFAMANAHPEVKAVARFEAKSNDDDGVMSVLRTIVDRPKNDSKL